MADSPNSQLGSYTAQDIANEIIARRPDLKGQDPDQLVHQLIQARPEFQTYLKTEELTRFVNPYQAKSGDTGVIAGAKRAGKGLYEFFSGQAHALFDEPKTPEEQAIAHTVEAQGGNSALTLYLKRTSYDQGEAGRKAAAQSASQGDNLGVIQHSAEAALGYMSPMAVVSPSNALRSVITPSIVGAAAGRAGQGDIAGGATEAGLGLYGPHLISKGLGALRAIPGVPERVTPATPHLAETPVQAASSPNPVHSFTGADAPMRPYDPQGTRFAKGGTVGMEPINPAYNPPQPPAPTATPAAPAFQSEAVQNLAQAAVSPEQFTQGLRNETNALRGRRVANPTAPDAEKTALDKRILENEEILREREGKPQGQAAIQADVQADRRSSIDPTNAPQPPIKAFDVEAFHGTMDSVVRAEKNLASPNLTDRQRGNWQAAIDNLRGSVRDSLNDFFQRLAPESHEESLANIQAEAERLREQAKVGRAVLQSDPLAKAMRQEMAVRPIRPWRTGALELQGAEEGAQFQEIGKNFPGELRDEFHRILGDKVTTEGGIPEEAMTELKQKAQAGLKDARGVLQQRMEDIASRVGDPNIPKAELLDKALREEKRINGRDLLSEVRDLQSILGTSRERLRYTGKGEPVIDEQGVVRPAGSVGEKSLTFANKFFDKKNLNKIPDDAAWEARARDLERRATLLDTVAKKLGERRKAQLGNQGGFVGEGKAILEKPQIDNEATLLDRASKLGRATWTVSEDKPAGTAGWLSSDGKNFIDKGYLNHEDIAQEILPGVQNPYRAMLENGWIRKGTNNSYQVHTLSGKAIEAVENDLIRNGNFGQRVYLDHKPGNYISSLTIEPGWSDFNRAVQLAKRASIPVSERGVSGLEMMGSSAAGMSGGAALGYHVAGAPGALVGGTLGFAGGALLPALYRIPAVADVLSSLSKEIKDLGFSTAGGVRDVATSLTNFLAPKVGVDTKSLNAIMQMKGDIAASNRAAANVLDAYRKHVDKLGEPAQIDFIDRYKSGQPQATPELQALDGMIRQIDKENYDKITLFKPGTPFLENHFRLLYKTIPGATEEGFQNWLGKRPLAGSRGFLQQHVYETLSDAMANGGKPVTTNPIDLFLMGHADVQRFVHANMLWEWAKNEGVATFTKRGARPALGYVPLDDRISKVYFPASSGEGLVNPGQYHVQEGLGRLLNNYLSPDYIRQNIFGKKLIDAKNIWNGWELLGGFHAVTLNGAALVQNLNLAAQRMYNLGIRGGSPTDFMAGVRDLIKAPMELIKGHAPAYIEGRQLEAFGSALDRSRRGDQTALGKFTASEDGQKFLQKYPGAEALLGDAFTGGLNLKMPEELQSNISKSMLQDFADKRYISGTAKLAPAALYEMNKPLFDKYIPRLKLGMFLRDMSVQLKDRAPELLDGSLTREELARKVVNRTENVFGEMNFDNLFWNRTLKTSLQLFYRSVTWRLGTTLEFGSGIAGQGKELANAVRQGQMPRLDPNFGFVGGAILTLGVTAAVMQKVMSGQNPQGIADLTHPRTGEKNEQGRPVRLNVPGYGTEFLKLSSNPPDYITRGRAGWVDKLMESWSNKDFYGKKIGEPGVAGWGARALHVMAPQMIMNSNIERMQQSGASPAKVVLGTLGFSTASKSIDMSPAELKAQEIMVSKLPQGGRTDQQIASTQAFNRVLSAIQNKKPDTGKLVADGFKSGTLKATDIPRLQSHLSTPFLSQMLKGNEIKLNEVLDVYQVADQKEQQLLKPIIASKILDLKNMDEESRKNTIRRIQQAFASQQTSRLVH